MPGDELELLREDEECDLAVRPSILCKLFGCRELPKFWRKEPKLLCHCGEPVNVRYASHFPYPPIYVHRGHCMWCNKPPELLRKRRALLCLIRGCKRHDGCYDDFGCTSKHAMACLCRHGRCLRCDNLVLPKLPTAFIERR